MGRSERRQPGRGHARLRSCQGDSERAEASPGVNRDRVIAADGPTESLRAPWERSRLGLVCRAGFAGRGMTYACPNAAFFLLSGPDPRHASRVAFLDERLRRRRLHAHRLGDAGMGHLAAQRVARQA